MIETVKSILLFILVGLSLLLTYQLWYGQVPAQVLEQDIYERIVVEQPRELERVIEPKKIALHNEGELYVYKKGSPDFDQMWNLLSIALQQISLDALIDEDEVPSDSRQLLSYYMQPKLPVGEDQPWLNEVDYSEIEKVDLYAVNDNFWLVLSDSNNNKLNLLLPPGKAEQFAEFMDNIQVDNKVASVVLTDELLEDHGVSRLEVEETIYIPVETVFIGEYNMRPETLDQDLILKTFFVDYSMARVIEEKEGGLIYTDGERGLRLTDTGLEYSAPRFEEGQATSAYSEALVTSSSLISYHGGWPDSMRLEALDLSGWGDTTHYSAEWQAYLDGYPILISQSTRTLYNDSGLIHYARSLFEVENPIVPENGLTPAASWNEALEKAVSQYQEGFPDRAGSIILKDIYLAYAITTSQSGYIGKPVWFIIINNEQFILSAFELEPLREEDLL